jgi:hypothetical protein
MENCRAILLLRGIWRWLNMFRQKPTSSLEKQEKGETMEVAFREDGGESVVGNNLPVETEHLSPYDEWRVALLTRAAKEFVAFTEGELAALWGIRQRVPLEVIESEEGGNPW